MGEPKVQQLLQEGIAAAKAVQSKSLKSGQPDQNVGRPLSVADPKAHARELLMQVIDLDENNKQAWFWLSTVLDDLEDKQVCLENVLHLDPADKHAQAGLAWLDKQIAATQSDVTPIETVATSSPVSAVNADTEPELELEIETEPEMHERLDSQADEPGLTAVPPEQGGCPFCQQPLGSMAKSCPHCELPLVMDCPKCNTLMDVEWQRCTSCHFKMGDYQLAALYFTDLATAYQHYHRPLKAADAVAFVESLEPDQPDLYRQIGAVQAELGQPSAAFATLEKAIKMDPQHGASYITLGHILQKAGRWGQAEKVYRRAIKLQPQSAAAHYALGDLRFQRNNLEPAQKSLQRALKIETQHGAAWVRMGQIYEAQKKRSAAINAYHKGQDLLSQETFDGQLSRERLKVLQPKLPAQLARSWGEFMRQLSGPMLICILALFLDSGLSLGWVAWTGWLALLLALIGTPLWVSGSALPQNPFICSLVGQQGLGRTERSVVAFCGAFFWLLALTLILMPIGQSYPELPQ